MDFTPYEIRIEKEDVENAAGRKLSGKEYADFLKMAREGIIAGINEQLAIDWHVYESYIKEKQAEDKNENTGEE